MTFCGVIHDVHILLEYTEVFVSGMECQSIYLFFNKRNQYLSCFIITFPVLGKLEGRKMVTCLFSLNVG